MPTVSTTIASSASTTCAGPTGSPFESDPAADVATSLGSPEGLFVDGAGKIYIADTFGADQIIRIDDMTGTNWTTVGSMGSGALEFNAPKNVFVDSGGHIYVTDSFNYRIVRMDDMTGKNWTTFGTRGTGVDQFSFPTGIFVDGAGRIYVTDSDIANEFDRVVRIDDMTGTSWTTSAPTAAGSISSRRSGASSSTRPATSTSPMRGPTRASCAWTT